LYHLLTVLFLIKGQSGSGKTFTMFGAPNNGGIIQRTIELLFGLMDSGKASGWSYSVTASFVEVYNNNVRPLMQPNEDKITTKDQLLSIVDTAFRKRTTAANSASSQSHALMTIGVRSTRQHFTYCGSIRLVDLAGSENGAESQNKLEMTNINTSLLALRQVMKALTTGQTFVPFRDSQLTELLYPSLRGVGKALMFVNVSPLHEDFNHTISSLGFAADINTPKTTNPK
jgi:hypothetical protein